MHRVRIELSTKSSVCAVVDPFDAQRVSPTYKEQCTVARQAPYFVGGEQSPSAFGVTGAVARVDGAQERADRSTAAM